MSAGSELFDELAVDYAARPGVSYGRIWHNDGLKINGKAFAMVVRGELVVKVPAEQAGELVESGTAARFEPRPGRAMREWVRLVQVDRERWRALVADAYRYGALLTAE